MPAVLGSLCVVECSRWGLAGFAEAGTCPHHSNACIRVSVQYQTSRDGFAARVVSRYAEHACMRDVMSKCMQTDREAMMGVCGGVGGGR